MNSYAAMKVIDEVLTFMVFGTAVLLVAAFTLWHSWWRTVFGRALASLAIGIALVMIRPVLWYAGVYRPSNTDALAWLSIAMLALVVFSLVRITWMISAPHVRNGWQQFKSWRRHRHRHGGELPERLINKGLVAYPVILALGLGAMACSTQTQQHPRRRPAAVAHFRRYDHDRQHHHDDCLKV